MGSEPTVSGQEAETEPLAGPMRQLVEVTAGQVQRRNPRRFFHDVGDVEAVPPRDGDRLAETERQQDAEGDHVQRDPVKRRELIGGEVDSDEELVEEAEGDGQVRVEVDCVPGLVRRMAFHGSDRAEAHDDEQEERDGRPQNVRIGQHQGEELVDRRDPDAHRIADGRQDRVEDDQPDGPESDPTVGVRDPVLAEDLVQPAKDDQVGQTQVIQLAVTVRPLRGRIPSIS